MGPLVQLGLLCGPLVPVPLGRMVLRLLARFQPRVPSSEPLPPQSWPVIPPPCRPQASGLFLVSMYVRPLLHSWVFAMVSHLSP